VHIDVFGPVFIPLMSKFMYYVSFINDFSKNTWNYFSRNKSKVLDKFNEFKPLVKNQREKKIEVSRTDNDEEFYGNQFEKFYKSSV